LRKRKPSGQLKRGPFSHADIKRALKADGWMSKAGGNHQTVWEHPTKSGKIPVSESWENLQAKCPILRGMARTMKMSDGALLKLLQ
jgi:hypothetical protein